MISIHALPRKNATDGQADSLIRPFHFNPRTPSQECDEGPILSKTFKMIISIHALARKNQTLQGRDHF